MKNYLIFDGKNTKDYGIRIEEHNNFSTPQRVVESVKVPGRTGNVLIDDGSFENILFEYELILDCKSSNLSEKADEISKWLHGDYTYKDLTFSNSTKKYKAVVINKIDISRMFKIFGKALVTFEAYEVTSTPTFKSISTDEYIYINTNNNFNPVIKVISSGDCTIKINEEDIDFKHVEGFLFIDCYNMDCYKELEDGTVENCNNKMYGMFPKFNLGENKIKTVNCKVEVSS